MSFANLKNNRKNALQGLQKQVQQSTEQSGGKSKDPRKWKFSFDKTTKVGQAATIRFLPWGNGERLPWAEWFEFSFKTAAGNYWNRSLKSVGKEDPVAEFNALQWERNQGRDQDDVRGRKRKVRYIANIVVLNDPANSDNNGKVFLWEFGPAIHEIIMKAMVPEYEDQTPVQVFDFWEGANFKLRSKEKNQFLTYEDSAFDAPSKLHDDDNVLETIYNAMHPLEEFEADENYKSYEDLEKEMIKVLGARYVAGVRGEEFSPEQAAQSGSNPFASEDASKQIEPTPTNSNPFEQQNNQAEQKADNPFANQTQQTEDKGPDPFANNVQEPGQEDDPFANLNLN